MLSSAAVGEPQLLHDFFALQVRQRPNHIAVEALGDRMTYAELDRRSNQIAHWLRERGIGPGSLVGIYLGKSCRLYTSILGVLKAGAGYVPVDPRFPKDRIQDIFADAATQAVISESTLAANLTPNSGRTVLCFDTDALTIDRQPVGMPAPLGLTSDDICYVIYTSGTTGRPKGVMIAHRNAVAFVRTLDTVYRISANDRIYQGFSVAFDASVEEIWAALAMGGTLLVPPEDVSCSPMSAAQFITANHITFVSTVPTFLTLIDCELPTVRLLVLGGEACLSGLVERWAKPGRRVLNTYGPTESTVVATWAECCPGAPITIGRALPGYCARVLDEQLRPVPPGAEGELFIGGDGVALGYLNRPELTAERFILDPLNPQERLYRTHDFARVGHDGELHFLGRIDGQVKIRGFRVEMGEIEAVLMEHRGIQAAAVRVVSGEKFPELAAYVVAERGADLDRGAIAKLLRTRLPDYMIPKYLDVLEMLPTLTNGKIDRKSLPAPTSLLKGTSLGIVAPASELECVVARVWEKCLQVSPVSVEDDFFVDLGGHSLLAAHVMSELRKELQTSRLSVRDIYKYPTVRALAARLRELGVGRGGAAVTECEAQPTPSELTFRTVAAWQRCACVALQAAAIALYYGILAAPLAYAVLVTLEVMAGRVELGTALWFTTGLAFAYWPALLTLSVLLKWLVIGRYRPGRYPLWSFYYFRWWLVNRYQLLSWSHMFSGTPLMSLYYRAMGAKIGKDVTICTTLCSVFDLVSIGDGASIGTETQLLGYRVEDGMLVIGRVEIGPDCFVGMHCNLGLDTSMGESARLDDMSALSDGVHLQPGDARRGSPAMSGHVAVPDAAAAARAPRRRFLYGAIHLALIYAMGYFLILAGAPTVALVGGALLWGGSVWGIAAAFIAVPVSIAWYVLLLVAFKRIFIGRIEPGTYALESGHYLRHWFLNYALDNTRRLLLPLYATVYFPSLLRWLGAKIGAHTEISTVLHVTPDLIDIGTGSFLADACLIGGCRIHGGLVEIKANRIGEKSFIGNSALLPAGTEVGREALLGVLSCPPPGLKLPDGERWLGSPAFVLPRTQKDVCFDSSETYCPTRSMFRKRAISDAVRVLLPGMISSALLVAFVALLVVAAGRWPLELVALAVPAIATALALGSIGIVAAVKGLLIGTFEPTVRPLWCRYVWNNEIVNGTYESVAAVALTPLLGTPFASVCLRWMGCRIGRWAYVETTFFSEFDLVQIGDHAAINLGATIQTHLFEDRVMKADHLHIGVGATVGNMAVVLYGTHINPGTRLGPLSLLMKGETLPAMSSWSGIPSEPMDSAAQPVSRPSPRPPARSRTGSGFRGLAHHISSNEQHLTPAGRLLARGIVRACTALRCLTLRPGVAHAAVREASIAPCGGTAITSIPCTRVAREHTLRGRYTAATPGQAT